VERGDTEQRDAKVLGRRARSRRRHARRHRPSRRAASRDRTVDGRGWRPRFAAKRSRSISTQVETGIGMGASIARWTGWRDAKGA
jgi:hypothetical protein